MKDFLLRKKTFKYVILEIKDHDFGESWFSYSHETMLLWGWWFAEDLFQFGAVKS